MSLVSSGPPDEDIQLRNAALIMDQLRMTGGWVLLCGTFGAVMSVVLCIAGCVEAGWPSALRTPRGAAGSFFAAAIYGYPSIHLLRYGWGIKRAVTSGRLEDLEGALGAQRAVWQFFGVLTLIVVVLIVLTFVNSALGYRMPWMLRP